MTPAENQALAGLAGRALTADEVHTLEDLIVTRNDVAIAVKLSEGRMKHGSTQIGPGTIVAILGDAGGALLDDLQTLGQTDRAVFWAMNPINRGVFDLSIPAARASLASLKGKLPSHAGHIDTILQIGLVQDPIQFWQVSVELNKAQGLMTI